MLTIKTIKQRKDVEVERCINVETSVRTSREFFGCAVCRGAVHQGTVCQAAIGRASDRACPVGMVELILGTFLTV